MMHPHRSLASAHSFNAESRLAFRRGNFNNQPQYIQQPQVQPQMQNHLVQANAYNYQPTSRLTAYAKGCKDVFLNRMNKMREHIATKGGSVHVDHQASFKRLDAYFSGDFKNWIERYEKNLENNAVTLEDNLKKCETAIDNMEKKLYEQGDLPKGKVFSERVKETMENVAIDDGIAVEAYGANGALIDVPSAWGVELVNATMLPPGKFTISGGRTRLHFQPNANSAIKITIGDMTIESAVKTGQTISMKPYKDALEAHQREVEAAAKLKAETDARSAVNVKAEKIDEAIATQEKFRTPRKADGTPVAPLNQIPSDTAKMEVEAIKETKAELEAQKGNIPENEYDERMAHLNLSESEASRKQMTLTVQEAVRLMREDQPEAAQKKLDEVQSRFSEVYGVFDPSHAEELFKKDNISQLSAEDGYISLGGKGIDGGKQNPRAKGEQPYKLIYEGKGKIRLEKDGNYAEKFNEKVNKRNDKLALHEISEALSKALGVSISEHETSAALTAVNIAGAIRDKHDNAIYLHSGDNKLYQTDFGVDSDLESGKAKSFRELLEKQPVEALRRLSELPVTEAGAQKVKLEASAALARFEQARELNYQELEQQLASLKEKADALRSLQKSKAARSPEFALTGLNNVLESSGLNKVRVNKDGDAKYGPDISWFGDRINAALGGSFQFADGIERRAVYNKELHKITLEPVTKPVINPVAKPKASSSPLQEAHDVVLEAVKTDTLDTSDLDRKVNEGLERSLKLAEQQNRIGNKLMEEAGAEGVLWNGNKARIEFSAPQPTKEQMQKIDEIFFAEPNGDKYTLLHVEGNIWEATL